MSKLTFKPLYSIISRQKKGVMGMERIISYEELPKAKGQTIYLRMETDPKLYISLLSKGYRIVNNIRDAQNTTIYVTGRRQDYQCSTTEEYKEKVTKSIEDSLKRKGIEKPKTRNFSYENLKKHKYDLPFVLKNENQNGGREKFLIATEEDYHNLIRACDYLRNKGWLFLSTMKPEDPKGRIDYEKYLETNFMVQEYVSTPSEFNTTVRLLTSASNDLLYATLKYNQPTDYEDDTTLLGFLLHDLYPLSTKSIVSNTLSGGENILIGEEKYSSMEKRLLEDHHISSKKFQKLVTSSKDLHEEYRRELGILCGFDYIYDEEKQKWFLLEYHSRPMVGDYSKRQGISYETNEDRLIAEGRVRATALSLILRK